MGTVEIIGLLLLLISVYLCFYNIMHWVNSRYAFKVFTTLQILLNILFLGMIITGFILFPALTALTAFSDPTQYYGVALIVGGGASLFVLYSYFIYRTSFFTGLLIAVIILPFSIIQLIKMPINLPAYRKKYKTEKES